MFDRYNYVVIPEKKKVVAYSTYAGQSVRGIAKCAPDDEFDVEFGKKLAAARCNVKVARKRFKRALEQRDAAWDNFIKAEDQLMKEEDYVDDSNVALTEAEIYLGSVIQDYEAAAKNVQHINVSEYDKTPKPVDYKVTLISATGYEPPVEDEITAHVDAILSTPKRDSKFCKLWKWLLNN